MATTLIKLNGTGGDIKEMTTAEEAYIAYQVSTYLASASWVNTDVGTIINSTDTNQQPIGVFTNTFFNQGVGTHPGTSISSGSTAYTLKQQAGTRAETGLTYPISWSSTGNVGINQMTSAELDSVCDRILAYIMTNQWAGIMAIATTTPTNYTLFRSSVFSDTRADGTNTVYNLYKKTTLPTAPTTVRPVRLNGTAGDMREMTDSEIQLTFGQRVINRMVSTNDRTGRYFLGTSAPTSNGYTGTWVSLGTYTDTKLTTAETDYSANYSADYQINRTANTVKYFASNVTKNRATDYQRNRTANFQRSRAEPMYFGGYTHLPRPDIWYGTTYSPYSGRWTPASGTGYYAAINYFLGDYIADYIGNFVGDYLGDYVHDYAGDYVTDYIGNYTGDYVGNYVGTTVSATSTTVSTYTLYVRTA